MHGKERLLIVALSMYICIEKELANVKVLLSVLKQTKGSNKETCLTVLKATASSELYHQLGCSGPVAAST